MNKAGEARFFLNYLIVSIMLFLIAVLGGLVYSGVHMKDRIVFRVVQQTELISDIIALNATPGGAYSKVTSYGDLIGVDDIGIFRLDGREAFGKAGGKQARAIEGGAAESFRKAVSTMNSAGFFDQAEMSYTRYVPLRNEGACVTCHRKGPGTLGVLRIRLSAKDDFELLRYMRSLIWVFGLIAFLPATGLLIAGAVIREKNRTNRELEESNLRLSMTYNELNGTRHYLQMILDNSKAIIVTTDTGGRIVEFNREAENLLEYRKDEVVGKDVLMLYENPAQREDLLDEAMAADDSVWAVRNREVILRSKSGKTYHVSLTLSSMLDDRGRPIGTVGVGKDVTEQKTLQFKLIQSEKLAGIGTLASGIAHEINNPLAGILGMAEAALDEDDPALIKAYAQDIIRYTINASNIVKELSSYSRSTHNAGTSTVDMAAVIEDSIKMARHSESFKSIELVTDLQKGCTFIANSGEIQQVFINLAVNAVQAMGVHGTLTLRCGMEGAFVRAEVSDTGSGIPQQNLNQIFDPFFTTKPPGKGTGLGLYVVYKIVTRHKGTVEVRSVPGEGTSFILKFPAAGAAAGMT